MMRKTNDFYPVPTGIVVFCCANNHKKIKKRREAER